MVRRQRAADQRVKIFLDVLPPQQRDLRKRCGIERAICRDTGKTIAIKRYCGFCVLQQQSQLRELRFTQFCRRPAFALRELVLHGQHARAFNTGHRRPQRRRVRYREQGYAPAWTSRDDLPAKTKNNSIKTMAY